MFKLSDGINARDVTIPGHYWWLPQYCVDSEQYSPEFWSVISIHPKNPARQKSGLVVGPLVEPVDDRPHDIDWQPIETAPRTGEPVWLYNAEWKDADFNPTGVCDGYWDEYFDDMKRGTWVVAGWVSCNNVYGSYAAVPTHWAKKKGP